MWPTLESSLSADPSVKVRASEREAAVLQLHRTTWTHAEPWLEAQGFVHEGDTLDCLRSRYRHPDGREAVVTFPTPMTGRIWCGEVRDDRCSVVIEENGRV